MEDQPIPPILSKAFPETTQLLLQAIQAQCAKTAKVQEALIAVGNWMMLLDIDQIYPETEQCIQLMRDVLPPGTVFLNIRKP